MPRREKSSRSSGGFVHDVSFADRILIFVDTFRGVTSLMRSQISAGVFAGGAGATMLI